MNKNNVMIVVASLLLLASRSSAQTSEAREIARHWLSMNCLEAHGGQDERDNFLKYKDELKSYFVYVSQRGLELEGMPEEAAALGETYDRNVKLLNENKPAWVTLEYESKIRSVSREAFIAKGLQTQARNYQSQAVMALELIRLLPNK